MGSEGRKRDGIAAIPRDSCPLCGSDGAVLYAGLEDGLFGTSGLWNFRKCSNHSCRLVWLDPVPSDDDIGKTYSEYYTHLCDNASSNRWMKGFLSRSFWFIVDLIMSPTGLYQERSAITCMYLKEVPPGTLLEVGCGNGGFLNVMKINGWDVAGVETDFLAAANAKALYNLDVFVGQLKDACFTEETFDAIAMNHVIEHVSDPIDLVKECRRILKPQGTLVMTTPNIESTGHQDFKQHWLGLDAPRHLHLFNCENISELARRSGFASAEVRTVSARAREFALGSIDIRSARTGEGKNVRHYFGKAAKSAYFQIKSFVKYRSNSETGEEIVLKARR